MRYDEGDIRERLVWAIVEYGYDYCREHGLPKKYLGSALVEAAAFALMQLAAPAARASVFDVAAQYFIEMKDDLPGFEKSVKEGGSN